MRAQTSGPRRSGREPSPADRSPTPRESMSSVRRHSNLAESTCRPERGSTSRSVTRSEQSSSCFRQRHRLGEDLAVGGLRRYLRRPRAQPGRVLELAQELRIRTPIHEAMRNPAGMSTVQRELMTGAPPPLPPPPALAPRSISVTPDADRHAQQS